VENNWNVRIRECEFVNPLRSRASLPNFERWHNNTVSRKAKEKTNLDKQRKNIYMIFDVFFSVTLLFTF
jgi:hypothetical protein